MNRIHTVLGFFLLASTFACSSAMENTDEQSADLSAATEVGSAQDKPATSAAAKDGVVASKEKPELHASDVVGAAKDKPELTVSEVVIAAKERYVLGDQIPAPKDPGAPVQQAGF
jgi:hypothetical protein